MESHGHDRTVFLAGNYEAQRLACHTHRHSRIKAVHDNVRRHFVYSCLISDLVIQPVAHYHQSRITRSITGRYREFFRDFRDSPPTAAYAVSYRKGTFHADANEKTDTYTDNFACYKDAVIRDRLSDEVSSISVPFFRKGDLVGSLSSLILANSSAGERLFDFAERLTGSPTDAFNVLSPLREAAKEQKYALIPEYLILKAGAKPMDPIFRVMRLTLLESYATTVGALYDAYAHNSLYPFYAELNLPYSLHYLDTHLFQRFIRMVPGIEETIGRASARQLLELKRSAGFQYFVQYYKGLIEELGAATLEDYKTLVIADYQKQTEAYQQRLEELLRKPGLVLLLHDALDEAMTKRRLVRSADFMSYYDIPVYALASEILERFTGKYEQMLMCTLKRGEYVVRQRPFRHVVIVNPKIVRKEVTMKIEKPKIVAGQVNIAEKISSASYTCNQGAILQPEPLIQDLLDRFCDNPDKDKLRALVTQPSESTAETAQKKVLWNKLGEFLRQVLSKGQSVLSDAAAKAVSEWMKQHGL